MVMDMSEELVIVRLASADLRDEERCASYGFFSPGFRSHKPCEAAVVRPKHFVERVI